MSAVVLVPHPMHQFVLLVHQCCFALISSSLPGHSVLQFPSQHGIKSFVPGAFVEESRFSAPTLPHLENLKLTQSWNLFHHMFRKLPHVSLFLVPEIGRAHV